MILEFCNCNSSVRPLHIGYAPASTADQNFKQQTRALGCAGCDRIFLSNSDRNQSNKEGVMDALSDLRLGDKLVVFELDRLGWTVHQLIKLIEEPRRRDVCFRDIADGTGAAIPNGGLFLQTITASSKMERPRTPERRRVGRTIARTRGREDGLYPKYSAHQIKPPKSLLADRSTKLFEIAGRLSVAGSTLFRAIERASVSRAE
jgi:DNA invertase Pin-like site-specific DNA recombinase